MHINKVVKWVLLKQYTSFPCGRLWIPISSFGVGEGITDLNLQGALGGILRNDTTSRRTETTRLNYWFVEAYSQCMKVVCGGYQQFCGGYCHDSWMYIRHFILTHGSFFLSLRKMWAHRPFTNKKRSENGARISTPKGNMIL